MSERWGRGLRSTDHFARGQGGSERSDLIRGWIQQTVGGKVRTLSFRHKRGFICTFYYHEPVGGCSFSPQEGK